MTEYMVLLHRAEDRAFTTAELEVQEAAHTAFQALCRDRGWPIHSTAPLAPAGRARSLRPDGRGGLAVTDGPYSETVEQVGGFYLVSGPSLDELTAAVGPLVVNAETVEIRPTDREWFE
ncbi:YciI family protein [Cellulomonas sp. McL0617]|uniref:YciI family protein n=1 Tax=Cellulomonas sp. McL0617 TaxID=3415675 RepID=UPI003CEA7B62